MLKLGMYCVYDVAAEAHIQPFTLPNDEMAKRAFGDCIQDPGHAFAKHPDQYTLFRCGEFQVRSGEIVPVVPPVSLGNGLAFVLPKE